MNVEKMRRQLERAEDAYFARQYATLPPPTVAPALARLAAMAETIRATKVSFPAVTGRIEENG